MKLIEAKQAMKQLGLDPALESAVSLALWLIIEQKSTLARSVATASRKREQKKAPIERALRSIFPDSYFKARAQAAMRDSYDASTVAKGRCIAVMNAANKRHFEAI